MTVFPFFVGRSRSGTTLVRRIFDSHPEVCVPPEAHFVVPLSREHADGPFDLASFRAALLDHPMFAWWELSEADVGTALAHQPNSFPDAIRALFAHYARARGKRCYANKTPDHADHLPLLSRLFPEAVFIHVIRDGRDVALSQVQHGMMPTVGHAAFFWRSMVSKSRADGSKLGTSRYMEIRYEQLISDTEAIVRSICDSIKVTFDPQMLHYFRRTDRLTGPQGEHDSNIYRPPTKGLRNWRDQMARADVEVFEAMSGDLLTELGYERAFPQVSARTRARGIAALARVFSWRARIHMGRFVPALTPRDWDPRTRIRGDDLGNSGESGPSRGTGS